MCRRIAQAVRPRSVRAALGAGFEPGQVTPHVFRHFAASAAIANGADVLVVQKMLGHKDAQTTLNVYGHLFPNRLAEVAQALDNARTKELSCDPDVTQTGFEQSDEGEEDSPTAQ